MSNKYLPFASVVVVKSSAVFPGVPGSNLTVVPSNPDSPTSFTPSPSVSYQTVSPIEPVGACSTIPRLTSVTRVVTTDAEIIPFTLPSLPAAVPIFSPVLIQLVGKFGVILPPEFVCNTTL